MKYVFSIALAAVAVFSFGVMAQDETKNFKQAATGICQKCPASGDAVSVDGGACQKCPASLVATVSTSTDKKCAGGCCQKCSDSSLVSVAVSTDDKCEGGCKTTCSACVVAAAMNKLPKMTYTIGTESTCCSEAAAELAKKSSTPIHYVVADKTYEDKTEAYTALVVSTEELVNAFVTPVKCETSGTTTVAGKSCGCCCEAGKRTELVTAAIKDIHVSYKVGDEEVCCPTAAAELAKKTGAATQYVVNGETTECGLTARLKVATAKYEAAVNAIAIADQAAAASATPSADATAESTTEKSGL